MRALRHVLLATSFVLILPACGPGGPLGEALPSGATNTTNEVGADMAVGHAKKPRARKWASSKKDAAAKKDGARKWDAAKKDAAKKDAPEKDGARKWDAAKKDAAYKYDEAPKAAIQDAAYKYDKAPKATDGSLARLNAVADKICGFSDAMKRATWLQGNQETFKSAMMEASASDPVASQEIMARIMGCLK